MSYRYHLNVLQITKLERTTPCCHIYKNEADFSLLYQPNRPTHLLPKILIKIKQKSEKNHFPMGKTRKLIGITI